MHTDKTTTLGADDGAGIAYILSVISDKTVSHPKLEILLTSDEEVSPQAIQFFNMKNIKAGYMINLDGEDYDVFNIGCTSILEDAYSIKNIARKNKEGSIYEISIKGLRGGHSGGDIHLNLANANVVLARLLSKIKSEVDFNLVEIFSGRVMNAIPDFANCKISTHPNNIEKIKTIIQKCNKGFTVDFDQDNKIEFNIISSSSSLQPLTDKVSNNIINSLEMLPNGVISYDDKAKIYSLSCNL
jgi:dipeptidase D